MIIIDSVGSLADTLSKRYGWKAIPISAVIAISIVMALYGISEVMIWTLNVFS